MNNELVVKEIEALKSKGENALDFAHSKADEYENFENQLKDQLREHATTIRNQAENSANNFADLENSLKGLYAQKRGILKGNKSHKDKKNLELRIPFSSLDKLNKWVGEYSQFGDNNRSHLEKEITAIETMLFTARQRVARNIEAAE